MKIVWSRFAQLTALCAALAACATSPPSEPDNICSIFTEKRAWHRAARAAESRWLTSMPVGMAIIYQESSYEHDARPPRRRLLGFIPWKRPSSAYGYAQALDGTWDRYVDATGDWGRDRDDFEDAIDFVSWYMRQAIDKNGVAKTDAAALYLNYHEGLGGYRQKLHQHKARLLATAALVRARANRYARQYETCRERLKPSFLRRLFGG